MNKVILGMGRIVNRLLRLAGLEIQKVKPKTLEKRRIPWWRYKRVIQEFHDHLIETVFSRLPCTENRLDLLGKLEGVNISEAMWILDQLHLSLDVDGDVCEFGVAAGATSALLANEIHYTNKNLWLFDSFQGLPKPTEKDSLLDDFWNLGSIEAYKGTMSYPPEIVKSKLNTINFPMSRVKIIPGFIEQTLQSHSVPEKVCFAFVDVDFYKPVLTALTFLSDRMSAGGCIVVDDYGSFSSGAKAAIDEFQAAHPELFTLEFPPRWAGHFAILIRI